MPVVFDVENMLHLQFIAATSCLRATVFKVRIPSDKPRTDAFRKEVGQMALKVAVPDFSLDDSAAKEIQASVDKDKEEAAKKDGTGKAEEEEKEEAKQEEQIGVDEVEKLKKQFAELCKGL
jgi:ribosomal protein L12E/L44/L45/RPP1/RPP2